MVGCGNQAQTLPGQMKQPKTWPDIEVVKAQNKDISIDVSQLPPIEMTRRHTGTLLEKSRMMLMMIKTPQPHMSVEFQ